MKVYADTNFLTSLLCPGPHQSEARRLDRLVEIKQAGPYPMTLLSRLEFVNALQQSVYTTRHGVPGIRIVPEHALGVEAAFHEHIKAGSLVCRASVDEAVLENQFHTLVHRHTAKEGFRTYDILHVSTALALGCDTFWSFDTKAKKLAKLEGLAVN